MHSHAHVRTQKHTHTHTHTHTHVERDKQAPHTHTHTHTDTPDEQWMVLKKIERSTGAVSSQPISRVRVKPKTNVCSLADLEQGLGTSTNEVSAWLFQLLLSALHWFSPDNAPKTL